MIVSRAVQATTSSATLEEFKMGRQYLAIQNHDLVNSVCLTIGGPDAVISVPNGMVVKAGEYGELRGRVGAKLTLISENALVNCTFFED